MQDDLHIASQANDFERRLARKVRQRAEALALTNESVEDWICALQTEGVLTLVKVEHVPANWQSALAAAQRKYRAYYLGQRSALSNLATAAEHNELSAIVLKGMALGAWLYPKPTDRMISDIDLWVTAGQAHQWEQMLVAQGFSANLQVADLTSFGSQLFYKNEPGGATTRLDVHCTLTHGHDRDVINYHGAWERSICFGDNGLRRLDLIDATLHAAVHLYNHHKETPRLVWLNDLALLTNRIAQSDENVLLERLQYKEHALAISGALAMTQTEYSCQFIDRLKEKILKHSESLPDLPRPSLWKSLSTYIRHAVPSPAYMRQRYQVTHSARLPGVYLRRIVSNIRKHLRDSH